MIAKVAAVGGDFIYLVALPWYVLQETESTVALASIFAAAAVPRAVLLPVGGVLADRLGAVRILALAAVLRALILLALVAIVWQGSLLLAYPLAFLLGCSSGLYYPAEAGVLPGLVGRARLASANGMSQSINHLLTIIGPGLGGLLVAQLGVMATLLIAAGGYVLAVPLLLAIPFRRMDISDRRPSDPMAGMRFVWHTKRLRVLLMMLVLSNLGFIGPFYVGLPLLTETLRGTAETYGLLLAGFGAGSLGGAVAVSAQSRLRSMRVALVAFTTLYLAVAGLAFAPSTAVAVSLVAIAGFGSGIGNVVLITTIQRLAPPRIVSGVMGVVLLASFGVAPVSQLAAGIASQSLGPGPPFLIGAIAGLAGVALVWSVWDGRHPDGSASAGPEPP